MGEAALAEQNDIERRPPRILGFGQGTHACIGLHVARLEADIALRELLARIPGYGIREDSLERYQTEFVQGFSKMQVVCRGA